MTAIVFLRLPEPRQVADPRTWLTPVEVRIVPPPPPVPPPVVESASHPVAAAGPRRQQRHAEPRKKTPKEEQPELATQPARESTFILTPAESGSAPRFDREAAKAAARDIAGELGPPQIALRETRQEKLGRKIQSAARPNCKDGIPGGLLAPLYLMMDKKDSGCKW
ncbi:hypothetical protein GM658_20330 [Pseudoduganella eburnea]|uniref:Uncharacterized protein n=1 Tax=Massilia eburnea TaxID=1776165 RepID=A0A6L6QKG3_9BURK|nr:hypothetical protein [Massilia eburnea]MTW12958.1 hypothetical protein [Massilia eburnea]